MEYVAIIVIVLTVFFDALRDGFINDPNWWKRHIFKWLAFYIPILYIMIVHVGLVWWWILLVPCCWIIWQVAIHYIAKKKWESMWIRWIKKIL